MLKFLVLFFLWLPNPSTVDKEFNLSIQLSYLSKTQMLNLYESGFIEILPISIIIAL